MKVMKFMKMNGMLSVNKCVNECVNVCTWSIVME